VFFLNLELLLTSSSSTMGVLAFAFFFFLPGEGVTSAIA